MKKALLIIAMTFVLFGCTKDEITPRDYPRIRTYSVTEITPTGARFNGEITFTSVDIVDHGFLWHTTNSVNFTTATKISLGPKSDAGLFDVLLDTNLPFGKTFYMRTYAISNDNVVYGEMVAFKYTQ
ncbi:MAG: hypothetical protein ABI663_07915 [Chryseolinea sp.]